jgi:hypothetical protein
MNAALQKLSAANTKRSMAQQNAAVAQRASALEKDLKAVEPWIVARLVRNGTQARMEKARQEYSQAIAIKDKRLGEAQARFNTLQVWITNQRAGLKGSEQDAAYWQTVSGIKKRAVSEYADMEADLSSMDCFPDVASLLSEIRARRKNAEAIRIGKVAAKTPPATPKTAASRSSLAGWWVWLRGSDRVPMILEAHGNSVFRGVYFPGITTRNIVSGKGPTVAIGFQALGDNKFKYRYKYPGSGDKGGRGGGVMTLSGNRMSGAWADDAGGAKGNWTLERATAAERAKLRKHFGRG